MMQPAVFRLGKTYTVTTSTTTSAALGSNFTACVKRIRVVAATSPAFVLVAAGTPTASAANGTYIPVGVPEYFTVSGNANETLAALASGAAGTLYVTELTE